MGGGWVYISESGEKNDEQLEENVGEREVLHREFDGRPQRGKQPRLLGRGRDLSLLPLGQALPGPQARPTGFCFSTSLLPISFTTRSTSSFLLFVWKLYFLSFIFSFLIY